MHSKLSLRKVCHLNLDILLDDINSYYSWGAILNVKRSSLLWTLCKTLPQPNLQENIIYVGNCVSVGLAIFLHLVTSNSLQIL